ncbi:MAG: cytochrome c maturation protein CcmE [Thermoplasmata archaeon]
MESEEPGKPKYGAKKKLVLQIVAVLAIIVVLVVIFLSSAPADPYDTVGMVMSNPSKYVNENVEVRGRVEAWSPSYRTFNLTGDGETVAVSYDVLPDAFANGKDVVVKGLFHHNGITYQIDASDIIVGCSSRY